MTTPLIGMFVRVVLLFTPRVLGTWQCQFLYVEAMAPFFIVWMKACRASSGSVKSQYIFQEGRYFCAHLR